MIHIAVHGVGNQSEPDRAAMLLAPGNSSEDGLWQSREIVRARLNADVVVLSACETATGRLIAGAKSVVASLWQVDDRSSARRSSIS